jgi:inositol transporter-like SP family MFS transporter
MASTPDGVIPSAPLTARNWQIAIVGGMASYLDSAAIVTTGVAIVMYQKPLGISGPAVGVISFLLSATIAAGALLGGRLGDIFGRRRIFTVTMILYAAGALLLTLALNRDFLYVGVLLVGLAAGADLPVSLTMISEESPEGQKGKMVAFTHIMWTAGTVVVDIIGIFVGRMGLFGGRILYAHLLIISLTVLVLRYFLPESGEWLKAKAARVTSRSNGVQISALKQLFHPPYIFPLITLGLFYTLTGVGANTFGQFGTYMYVHLAGSNASVASAFSLVNMAVNFVAASAFMLIVDRGSRLKWVIVGSCVYVVGYGIPIAMGFHIWTLALTGIVATFAGAFSGETLYKVLSQELFPTLLRSTAQGITTAFARFSFAVVALWTPAILAISPSAMFAFVIGCVTVGGAIGVIWVFRFPKVDEMPVQSAISTGPKPLLSQHR